MPPPRESATRDLEIPLGDRLVGAAHEAYVAATDLYKGRGYQEALAKFYEAFAQSDDRRLLFYMALCLRDLEDYQHAIDVLRRFLNETPPGAATDLRKQADDILFVIRWKVDLRDFLVGPAGEAFMTAKSLFDARDFDGARLKYEEAYRHSPDPRLRYNAGVCQYELKHYRLALKTMEDFHRESAGHLKPKEARELDVWIRRLRSLVSVVTLVVDQAGAAVFLDGERVGDTPLAKPLEFDLGTHEIRVSKSGFRDDQPIKREFGAGKARLEIKLNPLPGTSLLTIDVTGPGMIYIDGMKVGEARWESLMRSGEHSIRVVADGWRTYAKTLVLADGSRHDMTIALEREIPLWLKVLGAGLLVAGAGVGALALSRNGTEQMPVVGTLSPGTIQLPLRLP